MRQPLRIADRRLVLVQGEVRFAGSPSALAGEGQLMDLYFGRKAQSKCVPVLLDASSLISLHRGKDSPRTPARYVILLMS